MNNHFKQTSFTDESAAATLPIPRATIEEIVGYRNLALKQYEEAYDAAAAANEKLVAAFTTARKAFPGNNSYNEHSAEEVKRFHRIVAVPPRDEYLRVARRLVDINVWSYIVERTELERLMDKEAKDKLRDQLRYVPDRVDRDTRQIITGEEIVKGMPPVTVENIYATLEQFTLDADMIFRRGLANAFSKLDRRFRSHDGFKIGSRIVLTRAFDDWGQWNYRSNERDAVIDIERVFRILDGETIGTDFTSTIGQIDYSRRGTFRAHQSKIDTDYFRVRIFKNGNAHLWFERKDLLEKVNKILAEHYGETVGDGRTADENQFDKVKTTPAKYFGFYPTPDEARRELFHSLPTYRDPKSPRLRVLEPSAGTGNLIAPFFPTAKERHEYHSRPDDYRWDAIVDAVELQPHLAEALRRDCRINRVFAQDFLSLRPATTGLYDIVVMNPPFDLERDIDHVMHALDFLKPEGRLHAIMSAGTEFRETKKAVAFRALMKKLNARWRDLPPGSFASVGTYVNTITLRVRKDGGFVSY